MLNYYALHANRCARSSTVLALAETCAKTAASSSPIREAYFILLARTKTIGRRASPSAHLRGAVLPQQRRRSSPPPRSAIPLSFIKSAARQLRPDSKARRADEHCRLLFAQREARPARSVKAAPTSLRERPPSLLDYSALLARDPPICAPATASASSSSSSASASASAYPNFLHGILRVFSAPTAIGPPSGSNRTSVAHARAVTTAPAPPSPSENTQGSA
ncbi:hypothetical protein V8E36_005235 [Tilletia maclaganii]